MKFGIATVEYLETAGFDCAGFRKSVDGTQAIAHLEYIKTLIPSTETDENVTIYTAPSTELTTLLNSAEWTVEE
jgi:hypothetical protein